MAVKTTMDASHTQPVASSQRPQTDAAEVRTEAVGLARDLGQALLGDDPLQTSEDVVRTAHWALENTAKGRDAERQQLAADRNVDPQSAEGQTSGRGVHAYADGVVVRVLERLEEIQTAHRETLEGVRSDVELSAKGCERREAESAARALADASKALAGMDDVLVRITKREAALLPKLTPKDAAPPIEAARLRAELRVSNLLRLAGDPDKALDLLPLLARDGDPLEVAALAELVARAHPDPLSARAALRSAGRPSEERRQRALLGDPEQLKAATEAVLLRRLRERVEALRSSLQGDRAFEVGLARQRWERGR